MHFKKVINYYDYTNCYIVQAHKFSTYMCLYNISGQIVRMTGKRCNPPLPSHWINNGQPSLVH